MKEWKDVTSLYDPNNFYYCRLVVRRGEKVTGLYDPNNFYYCRYSGMQAWSSGVYMTQTISTIVDEIVLLHYYIESI